MKKLTASLIGISMFLFGCVQQAPQDERCFQTGTAKGMCHGIFYSYQYDAVQKKCMGLGMSGCSVDSPFESVEECQNICEK